MDHKQKLMLNDVSTWKLFVGLEFGNLTAQIIKLVHEDFTNFFIASTPSAISETLARASSPYLKDGPYFSDKFAWYSMSMVN